MREILFRGKNKVADFWVYGDLRNYEESGAKAIFSHELLHRVEVHTETVGQYTGLTDKNGTKIFEGDVVLYAREEELGQIAYRESEAMFCVEFDTWFTDFDHMYEKALEVIGNIHDNPELLKGENDA